jgi:hypothetical protein
VAEKGKNLATKEDIQEITRRVESVRSAFERGTHVHRVQFETEFAALTEIWKRVTIFRATIAPLHPRGLILRDPSADPEEVLTRDFGVFVRALNELTVAVDEKSPFYPENIHADLEHLLRIGNAEMASTATRHTMNDPNYERYGAERITQVVDLCKVIATKIRERIASLSVYGGTT